MTLTDFLLARIDEDEEMARAATPAPWVLYDPDEGEPYAGNFGCLRMDAMHPTAWPCDAAHMARHDPARVLAECAAKRRVVAMSDGSADFEAAMPTPGYAKPYHSPSVDVMTRTRQLLALPYADHPDYDEAWRP